MEEAKDCDCVPEAKDCDDDPMEVDADPQDLDEKYSTVSETSCNTHTSSSSSMCQCETSEEEDTNEKKPQDETKSIPTKTKGETKPENRSPYTADYATKLNYLFRDCRFFLMKSCNSENISLAKAKGVWSTLVNKEILLDHAVRNCRNVILIFSAERSGKFSGFARLRGTARYDMVPIYWLLSSEQTRDSLGGIFKLDWVNRMDLSFDKCGHLYNSLNDSKLVKVGRNGQEIDCEVGKQLCRLFAEDKGVDMTPILYKSKRAANELAHKRVQASQREYQRDELRGREKQPEHHFADRQRPYKRRDDHRPRMEERLNWSRRDEEHPRDRDLGLYVRGRWSVVYNRYINCNVWRYHMPTNYADRRHARVMNRSEENFMHRGRGRNLRQLHRGRGGYTHAGGYRERWLHSYRHPYQR